MSNFNNQYGGNNTTNQYGYGVQNKLESFNNIENMIDQTPKKNYKPFPLSINSSHLVNIDKENSFIKANNDNINDINSIDHFQNNYQIPSQQYPYNSSLQHQIDPYNYQFQNYGFYYPQQPYYGYDYTNGQYNPSSFDPQAYQPHLYNTNCYFNKTPLTGHKIQQNIILQKSENKLTGQPNQNGQEGLVNKKEVTDFSLNTLVQQVNISEFLPNDIQHINGFDKQQSQNQAKQNSGQVLQTPQSNPQIAIMRGKSSKQSMDQESEQQQEELNRKSKITPSKRISKKKQRSVKQTPSNQSIQDNDDHISNKTDATLQQSLINSSNNFNKALNLKRQNTSEQTYEQMISEEDFNNFQNDKETLKNVKLGHFGSQNSQFKQNRASNASTSMISNSATVYNNNSNMNNITVNLQNNPSNNILKYGVSGQYQNGFNNTNLVNNDQIDQQENDENDPQDVIQNLNAALKQNYSNMIQTQQDQSSESSNNENQGEVKPCNCRNSKCLKRYCDCFAAGLYCQAECKCEECHNKPEYEDERQKAIQKKKKRIKDAFQPVIQNNSHIKGCNCKNSHCLKKYCVCHQNGVLCSSLCQCVECENKIESMKKENPQPIIQQVQQYKSQVSLSIMQQQIANENVNFMNNPNQITYAQQNQSSPFNQNLLQKNKTEVEFPTTIKKDFMGIKNNAFEEDFSTLKKPSKRKAFKSNEKQKALSFFNEVSPADNKYLINKS